MNSTLASQLSAAAAIEPRLKTHASTAVVIPTYREAQNLPLLIDGIREVRETHGLDLDVYLMDDDSRDGTVEWADDCEHDWVHLIVRTENRGLSPAVLDGFEYARQPFIVVMDADLSHPPERIVDMLDALESGSDFVIGSRYVRGGSTDEHWGMVRLLNSKVATWLARPLTPARDPMSGFFAFRRSLLVSAGTLNPVGYKIGLELIVKSRVNDVAEIPIHFSDRRHGESKLTFREQLKYVRHLRRLYTHKFGKRRRAVAK